MDLAKKLTQGRRIIRIPGTKVITPPKPPAPLPPLEWAKKKCLKGSHVVGFLYNWEDTDLVHASGSGTNSLRYCVLDEGFHPFNCCPYCGRRVDRIIKTVRKQEEKKCDAKVNVAYKQEVKKYEKQVKALIKERKNSK